MIESGRFLSNTVALTRRCPPPFRGWSSPTTTSCAASTRSTPGPGGRGGFVTYPLIEDDSVARRLVQTEFHRAIRELVVAWEKSHVIPRQRSLPVTITT